MSSSTGPETIDGPTSRVEHLIGEHGRLVVHVAQGELTIRGVDGGTATVEDRAGRESFVARRGPDSLEVGTPDEPFGGWGGSWGGRLGGSISLRFGRRRRADLDIAVPRGASLDVVLASASVSAQGLSGSQRYLSVSGDILVVDAQGGTIQADSVSGDVTVRGRGRLEVKGRTISGEVVIAGDELAAVQAQTTSGQVRLSGVLAGGRNRVETVSGDVLLATAGGLTISGRTISGDIGSRLPHRSQGGLGRRTLVIGDGTARLDFRSMSGDLNVVALAVTEPAAEPRLAILQALERGEIDVDEAGRQLAAIDQPPASGRQAHRP